MPPSVSDTPIPSRPLLGLPPRPLAVGGELRSHDLLRGRREIVIRHGDQTYRLRHTRNDKLILTK